MPHMVVFRTNEGKQAYHPTDALEDAIRFVEHLRNAEQVTDVHVFRMQEVPLEFKVLYKVEVGPASGGSEDGGSAGTLSSSTASGTSLGGSDDSVTTASSATAPAARTAEVRAAAAQPATTASAPAAPTPVAAAPAPDSGGRFGLFSRTS